MGAFRYATEFFFVLSSFRVRIIAISEYEFVTKANLTTRHLAGLWISKTRFTNCLNDLYIDLDLKDLSIARGRSLSHIFLGVT